MCVFFFFFQAEDGIRDKLVTGVQTCALPILISVRAKPSIMKRSVGWAKARCSAYPRGQDRVRAVPTRRRMRHAILPTLHSARNEDQSAVAPLALIGAAHFSISLLTK